MTRQDIRAWIELPETVAFMNALRAEANGIAERLVVSSVEFDKPMETIAMNAAYRSGCLKTIEAILDADQLIAMMKGAIDEK